jgi:hypothetical protein
MLKILRYVIKLIFWIILTEYSFSTELTISSIDLTILDSTITNIVKSSELNTVFFL